MLKILLVMFINKDQGLATYAIEFLLKHWKVDISNNEILYLNSIQSIFIECKPELSETLILKFFKRIICCLSSDNAQIVDAALCLFESDNFLEIVKENKHVVFPMVIPILIHQSIGYWNEVIKQSMASCISILKIIDPELVRTESNSYQISHNILNLHQTQEKRAELDAKWKSISEYLQNH